MASQSEEPAEEMKERKMGDILYVQQCNWPEVESSAKPVLVDFWAEWCPPCRMLAPTFEKLAANYGHEIGFAKVNVDELPEVACQYGIRSIPTLLLLRDGQVLEELVGARPYQDLARILDRHLAATPKSTEKSPPRVAPLAN
jgi:thioredoxin 1